jgi:arginyl-tRNA synthetase
MKLTMDRLKLLPEVNVTIKNCAVDLNRCLSHNLDPELFENCWVRANDQDKEITYMLKKEAFVKEVLSPKSSGIVGELVDERKNILVEFSSPNIAKPFHVGHLRSTIIGNFLSNLYTHLNQNVTRLNYLGDWGTQFGLLNVGIGLANLSDEDIKANPIRTLYDAYVLANQKGENDPDIREQAKRVFSQLEQGEYAAMDKWKMYKKYTIDELNRVYNRLGVTFDQYFWESDYGRNEIQTVLDLLTDKKILQDSDDGRKVVQVGDRVVPIVKSDGTTLYLTRDVAAFIDRYDRYKFDKMIYVVDHSQKNHFQALFSVAHQLGLPYAENGVHVRFGRIKGMSTRKGTAVFLQDILNEAKDIMREKQLISASEFD